MQILLKNTIKIDSQTELIEQSYPLEITEKGGYHYLIFTNEEAERVAIKCNQEELIMTRFSNPKTIMRFHRENPVLVAIPTPLGYQHLMTETETYDPDFEKQRILIDYKLKQPDTDAVFAEYQMEISWD